MTAPGVRQASILVVDDEANSLLAMRHLLDADDRNVMTASSGKEAVRMMLKVEFALILMDVRMPEMDGFETASLIRRVNRSRHTPIIFLSAAGQHHEWTLRG